MSLDELASRQQETGEAIRTSWVNYSKDSNTRKTAERLQRRLQTLDELWSEFEETDNKIRADFSDRIDHSYFVKEYYNGIESGYLRMRADIISRLQKFSAVSAGNASGPQNLDGEDDGCQNPATPGQAAAGQANNAANPANQQQNPSTAGQSNNQAILTRQQDNLEGATAALSQTSRSTGAIPKVKKPHPPILQQSMINQSGIIRKYESLMQGLQRLLSGLLAQDLTNQSLHFYKIKIEAIERYWSEIQTLHRKIWDQIEDPFGLGYDQEVYFNLEEQTQAQIIQLHEQMSQVNLTQPQSAPSNIGVTNHTNHMVKLPKIVLPKFDGDYLKWRQFRDLFMELVHNQPIAECQKMWYLKTSLSGEAERLIRHFTTSEANYSSAWKIINDRYENTRLLVGALLHKLISQSAATNESSSALKALHDTTHECLLALGNLGIPTDQWDPLLMHILIKKLDKTTHTLWEQSLTQPRKMQPLKSFLEFLETRFQSLEALGTKGKTGTDNRPHSLKSLASTVNTGTNCPSCRESHKLFSCPRFLQLSPSERISLVKKANICFNCLKPGHSLASCSAGNCTKCSRKHNSLLHLESASQKPVKHNTMSGERTADNKQFSSSSAKATKQPLNSSHSTDSSTSLTAKTFPAPRDYVLLSTILVNLVNDNGSTIQCRAILDSGSQINIITEKMVKRLGLKESPQLMSIEGVGRRKQQAQCRVNVKIQSMNNGYSVRLEAHVLPRIISPQPTQAIDISNWCIPSNIRLADPQFNHPESIDLLIGAELYYSILSIGQIKLGDSLPVMQNTVFGWTVAGKIHSIPQSHTSCGVCSGDELDQQLEKFWKLEDTAPRESSLTLAERSCENHYNQTTKRDNDGRFIVRLPFKDDPTKLGQSKDIALQRFQSLERRLAKQPELREQYIQFMDEYISLGHMKKVNLSDIAQPYFFLPHHCVVKPDSSTTKVRVVFDGSAKTSSNVSLNDILATGPKIQDDVFSILLRFRMPRFVFTADIAKMYRQVRLHQDDQKYQLIWWRSDPRQEINCYQLQTVTYGTTSASYLATKCLQVLAKEEATKFLLGAEVLARDFYVDDVLTGSNSLSTAIVIQSQLQQILQSAGFQLRKWCANHPGLLQGIQPQDQELQLDFASKTEDNTKTIGLTWLPKSDELIIKTSWKESKRVTKRTALSDIAHVFDPLGLLAPVTVVAKIFMQKLWELKIDWDAALPQELDTTWNQYREGLRSLIKIKIPRHVFSHKISKSTQFHVFADASEKAYGAAAYVRSVQNNEVIIVRLLCAKSRVAPRKTISLPRLELCAAKIAADLAQRIKKDLHLTNEPVYLWTDSEIVLSWINSHSSSYQTFVANRVSAIQELSTPEQWRHVPSKDNPADVLSRGIPPEKLHNSTLWFYGPPFLHGTEAMWPAPFKRPQIENDPERKRSSVTTVTLSKGPATGLINDMEQKYSFRKLQRILGYILRFVNHLKDPESRRQKATLSLTSKELDEAEVLILRAMQDQEFKHDLRELKQHGRVTKTSPLICLTPFLDKAGLIRVGGRLEASNLSYDAKHPVLLPYSHHLTKDLMNDIHRKNHHVAPQALLAITRQKFWPLKGKTIARSVVQHCVQCFKAKPKFLTQLMGNLPADRIQPARPFVNVGIDFCGPCYTHFKIRGKRPQKTYIAVFCCFATKATHLELVTDLTTQGFLGALKRFMGRRGHCKNIYCDNATNFVGAKNFLEELKDILTSKESKETITSACSTEGVDFHFIPPRTPHFGGLWEAAVKSAKHLLYKTLSSSSLTYEELETAIIEIEAILNSRPITPMSTDPNDLTALTPGHFLIGEPLTSSIDPRAEAQRMSMTERWKRISEIKTQFWQRWTNEYLNQLQHRYKWKEQSPNIAPGNMVIIKDDNTPVLKWPIGRVVNVIMGPEGLVRAVDVRTASGIMRRTIQRLAPLPIDDETLNNGQPTAPTVAIHSQSEKLSNKYRQPLDSEEMRSSSRDENANPRKKQRVSFGSLVVTALIACLVLPNANASPVTITPFKTQPGIYFENLGAANIITSEWKIIAYYDMIPYWKEFDSLIKCTSQLEKSCSFLMDKNSCSQILSQFKHLSEEIAQNNQLLLPQDDNRRTKRGAVNIIGNIANSLFGVLDSEYADKMSQTIDKINQNEDFLLQLIKNQTTVIDSTINIMKKEAESISKHFIELEARFNDRINRMSEELFEEKLSQMFTSLGLQAMLIASNFRRAQDAIIDVITDTHHGKVNPNLLSPVQLQAELNKIKNNLPSTLRLPTMKDDLLKYYSLMSIEGRATEKHIIFQIKLPLITLDNFELYKITPVPVLINNTFMFIKPSTPLLIISLHRDLYYPLTEQDLSSCISITTERYLCRQTHPIYHKGSTISACEVDFINHLPQSDSCQVMRTDDGPHWIQLHNPNQWIYVLKQKTTINIVCGDNVTEASLDNSGIISIQGDCVIKQPLITIRGHNVFPSSSKMSYIPSTNLSDSVIPERMATILYHPSHYQPHLAEMESIKNRLSQLPVDLPAKIKDHNLHQFTIGYSALLLIAAIIGYLALRNLSLCNRHARNTLKVDAKTPEADTTPQQDAPASDTFSYNINFA